MVRRRRFSRLHAALEYTKSSPKPGSSEIFQRPTRHRAPVPSPARDPALREPEAAPTLESAHCTNQTILVVNSPVMRRGRVRGVPGGWSGAGPVGAAGPVGVQPEEVERAGHVHVVEAGFR